MSGFGVNFYPDFGDNVVGYTLDPGYDEVGDFLDNYPGHDEVGDFLDNYPDTMFRPLIWLFYKIIGY
jgi:hypothetical protein